MFGTTVARTPNPEPTAWKFCCKPTAIIYFWNINVGNFSLKKRKTTPLNENFFLQITYAAKISKTTRKIFIYGLYNKKQSGKKIVMVDIERKNKTTVVETCEKRKWTKSST